MPRGTRIHLLVFDRSKFSRSAARQWAVTHGYVGGRTQQLSSVIRIQQEPAGRFESGKHRTVFLADGVQAMVGVPKAKWEDAPPPRDRVDRALVKGATVAKATAKRTVSTVKQRAKKATSGSARRARERVLGDPLAKLLRRWKKKKR